MKQFSMCKLGARFGASLGILVVAATSHAFILTHTITLNEGLTISDLHLYGDGSGGSLAYGGLSAGPAAGVFEFTQNVSTSSSYATFIGSYSGGIVMALDATIAGGVDTGSATAFFDLFGVDETTVLGHLANSDKTDLMAFLNTHKTKFQDLTSVSEGIVMKFSLPVPTGTYSVAESVPEPFTMALAAMGAGLGARRMMRRRAAAPAAA